MQIDTDKHDHAPYNGGMNEDRKRAVWPWAVGLLIGLPVLYVLSFGPACWISSQKNSGVAAVNVTYQPLMRAWWRGGPCESDLLQRYARWKAKDYWGITRDDSGKYRWADSSDMGLSDLALPD